MNTGLLHGEYELTLDEKNRLLIPAEIRRRLNPTDGQSAFFIKLGNNNVPWLYSTSRFAEVTAGNNPGMDPSDEELDRLHFDYAMTYELEWDKQGRAVVPERLLRKTGTGKDVMLVGSKDHLELWNKDAWEQRMDALVAARAMRGKTHQTQQSQGGV